MMVLILTLATLLMTACSDSGDFTRPESPRQQLAESPNLDRTVPLPANPIELHPGAWMLGKLKWITQHFSNQVQQEHDLATAYMDIFRRFHPDHVNPMNEELFSQVFGETFLLEESGVYSFGTPGPLDPSTFTVAETPLGGSAPLTDLQLWEYDPTPGGQVIAIPINFPYDGYGAYIFTARFGGYHPVIGYATHLFKDDESGLAFVPLVAVPDGGLITAAQAGEFLAMAANGLVGDDGFDFLAWAQGGGSGKAAGEDEDVLSPGADGPFAPGPGLDLDRWYCDVEALKQCLQDVATQYYADVAAAGQAHADAVNAIYKEWGQDGTRTLAGAIGGGATAGAITGACVSSPSGPGALAGAATGGLIGAIGGAVGWLIYEGFYADDMQEDLDEAKQDYHDAMCAAAQKAAADSQACFDEFCPELSEWWEAQMALWLWQMGC